MATKTKPKATAAYKVPIDQIMGAIDTRNGEFYEKLSEEDRKGVNSFMAQRWASSVQGDRELQEWYLLNTNDLLNIDYVAITSAHEELRWKLLSRVGVGSKGIRHTFIPPRGVKKDKVTQWLIEQFPSLSDEEIELFRTINGDDVLQDIAQAKNVAASQIKDLFK